MNEDTEITYRFLTEAEKKEGVALKKGDEFSDTPNSTGKWHPCLSAIGCEARLMSTGPEDIRRPV